VVGVLRRHADRFGGADSGCLNADTHAEPVAYTIANPVSIALPLSVGVPVSDRVAFTKPVAVGLTVAIGQLVAVCVTEPIAITEPVAVTEPIAVTKPVAESVGRIALAESIAIVLTGRSRFGAQRDLGGPDSTGTVASDPPAPRRGLTCH
jgi:hypothetical protein